MARLIVRPHESAKHGTVFISAFGMIRHHGPTPGPGRIRRERLLAKETMRLLRVVPLTEELPATALGYDIFKDRTSGAIAASQLGTPE